MFVHHPEADATNDEVERGRRGAAQDRRCGRTIKTLRSTQRRMILMSVLASLKLHHAEFTLDSVLTGVSSCWCRGESLFDLVDLLRCRAVLELEQDDVPKHWLDANAVGTLPSNAGMLSCL